MKTLEEEEEEDSTTRVDRFRTLDNPLITFLTEIIEEIFSRLPVKSILRFRTLSKPWLNRISHPSFTKLHFTCATAAHRTALFVPTYDHLTRKLHFFSAAHDGGPLTHLFTLDLVYPTGISQVEHLNGLVFCTSVNYSTPMNNMDYTFVVNPSTHKIFKLPDPASLPNFDFGNAYVCCFLFWFDESSNEHKILMIRNYRQPLKLEFMIFSMSSYSWRRIDVEPPIGFSSMMIRRSVCVNSVIHMMPFSSVDILGFDLRTEKFTIINTPQGVVPHKPSSEYTVNGVTSWKSNNPCIVKINGCIGIVCHDRLVENHEMHIWILQDYENRVWVKEIITFPESWIGLDDPYLLDYVNMDEIIFYSGKLSRNNKKSRCFKSLQFTIDHPNLCSEFLKFNHIRCYGESMLPLEEQNKT